MGVVDRDEGVAAWDRERDEAVVALIACGDGGAIEGDVPGWVVAEVEDEVFRGGGVDGEVRGGWGWVGICLWGLAVGVGGEPEGGIVVGEGVVVGGGGGVLVGGVIALVGAEKCVAGCGSVFFVAGLVEECVGRIGEGCG